jgi:hypothetical protein
MNEAMKNWTVPLLGDACRPGEPLEKWVMGRTEREGGLMVLKWILVKQNLGVVGRDSVVGIATRYKLDGPGIKSQRGKIFSTHPDRPWGLPSLLYNGYRVIPRDKAAGAWR